MNIFAIESSCDETAVAIVTAEEGILGIAANCVASQVETHRLYGGVVPEIASRAHSEAISGLADEALREAGLSLSAIDAVAVTDHPGLIGALLVGVNFAKGLAVRAGLPLVPVDHMRGHLAANYLKECASPVRPPYLGLAVSGGHTAIYLVEDYTKYTLLGSTRDDAIGESFDKIGRLLGIPYPAGAGFDRLAAEGMRSATGAEENVFAAYAASQARRDPALHLPSPALAGDTMDFSFSGLKTAAVNLLHTLEQKGEIPPRAQIAARYTYEAVEGVARKLEMAMERYPHLPLAVAGGVAANSHLRARLAALCALHGVTLHIPPLSLCGDNAAMIAAQGYYEYLAGVRADSSLNASAADTIL